MCAGRSGKRWEEGGIYVDEMVGISETFRSVGGAKKLGVMNGLNLMVDFIGVLT